MPIYSYHALTQAGQKQKGRLNAGNEKSARQQLRDQALIPLRIIPYHTSSHLLSTWLQHFKKRKLSAKTIALITRQLSALLSAGLTVTEGLTTLADNLREPAVKQLIQAVRNKVTTGYSLAASLREYSESFPALMIETIAAGEKSGQLNQVMSRIADYTEKMWHTQQKLQTACIYPAAMMIVAGCIIFFLLEYIVPKMVVVYTNTDQALPFLTKVLISVSNHTQSFLLTAGFIAIIGFIAFKMAWQKPSFKTKWQASLLRLPIIGYVIKTTNTARFARTLAMLTQSGVAITDAMTIAATLITPLPMRQQIVQAIKRVREGSPIHFALKQTGYFQPVSIHLLASGEASGTLSSMLEHIARNQEAELARLIEISLTLLEPIMILFMGAIVLFIVLAVLLPIFEMNQFIQ